MTLGNYITTQFSDAEMESLWVWAFSLMPQNMSLEKLHTEP